MNFDKTPRCVSVTRLVIFSASAERLRPPGGTSKRALRSSPYQRRAEPFLAVDRTVLRPHHSRKRSNAGADVPGVGGRSRVFQSTSIPHESFLRLSD